MANFLELNVVNYDTHYINLDKIETYAYENKEKDVLRLYLESGKIWLIRKDKNEKNWEHLLEYFIENELTFNTVAFGQYVIDEKGDIYPIENTKAFEPINDTAKEEKAEEKEISKPNANTYNNTNDNTYNNTNTNAKTTKTTKTTTSKTSGNKTATYKKKK